MMTSPLPISAVQSPRKEKGVVSVYVHQLIIYIVFAANVHHHNQVESNTTLFAIQLESRNFV